MNNKCTCGGSIDSWAINKKDESIYKDLGVCIDCDRNYILKDGNYKYISNAEFRRIIKSRRKKQYEMDIKMKLKERLLQIPINSSAFREKYRLADDLNIKVEDIEPLLNELVDNYILKEKFQYRCPNCGDITTMDDVLLKEIIDEEGECFECDNCMDFINPTKNRTGYIFYDIKDKQALINW